MKQSIPWLLLLACVLVMAPSRPHASDQWFDRGLALLKSLQYDEAIQAFSKVIEEDPSHADAYHHRGTAWHRKGDYERAITDYSRALEINPEFARAYGNRGAAWQQQGNDDRALADYRTALDLNPRQAGVYNNRGLIWHRKGDYDRAIADYTEALKINPRYGQAYANRGAARQQKGDYDGALDDYGKALEIHPGHAGAYNNRGLIYFRRGDYDRALADYTRAIEIQSRYADAYNGRGMVWYEKGDYARALSDYARALEINPRYAQVYNRLAWILATCQDDRYRDGAKALQYAQRAVALNPEASFLDTLAAAQAEAGHFEDAVDTEKRAMAMLGGQGRAEDLNAYRERLATYLAKRPWRVERRGRTEKKEQVAAETRREAAQDLRDPAQKTGAVPEKPYPYTIQVSSYRDRDKANHMAMQLRKKGHRAFTCHVRLPEKGDWYRVFVGVYSTREAANKAVRLLREGRFRNTLVLNMPYAIRVGLSESQEELQKLERGLWSKGYTAYTLPAPARSGALQLLIGAFGTEKKADAMAGELKRAGFRPTVVRR
jgi:tetratricopeptide (TPR) repeat protein/cell division septation protein DedD